MVIADLLKHLRRLPRSTKIVEMNVSVVIDPDIGLIQTLSFLDLDADEDEDDPDEEFDMFELAKRHSFQPRLVSQKEIL